MSRSLQLPSAASRAAELEALFAHIAATRMDGVPILNPALQVRAVGFEAVGDASAAVGVLVTPWFMNLVWLPLQAQGTETADTARSGDTRHRVVGTQRFPFIGAHEAGFGGYEACSLFSPMFEFADQASAVATAQAVLEELRRPPPEMSLETSPETSPEVLPEVSPKPSPEPAAPQRSRRALLFGRGAAAGGAR